MECLNRRMSSAFMLPSRFVLSDFPPNFHSCNRLTKLLLKKAAMAMEEIKDSNREPVAFVVK
jgi:hypothetical protein